MLLARSVRETEARPTCRGWLLTNDIDRLDFPAAIHRADRAPARGKACRNLLQDNDLGRFRGGRREVQCEPFGHIGCCLKLEPGNPTRIPQLIRAHHSPARRFLIGENLFPGRFVKIEARGALHQLAFPVIFPSCAADSAHLGRLFPKARTNSLYWVSISCRGTWGTWGTLFGPPTLSPSLYV